MPLLQSPIARRIIFAVVVGMLLAWALSEASFWLLRDGSDHAPGRVVLTIPPGTAAQVAQGAAVPALPPDLVFVAGDTLVVQNDDSVSHQLGPVWVPPGASASLALNEPNRYSYACSFQPSRALGLDVRARVTLRTRLLAVLLAGPPMAVLIAVYGLVLRPPQRRPSAA